MIIRLASALFVVACVTARASNGDDLAWWKASSSELEVEGKTLIGSGTNSEEWSDLIQSGVNPFGQKNKSFRLKIRDKSSGRSTVVPMVPVSFLQISDSSRFIVVLSKAEPTYGIAVVSRGGEVVFKAFDICFSNECPVISHNWMPWFHAVRVGVSFESTTNGIDCLLRLKEDKDLPESPELVFDVCKKQALK